MITQSFKALKRFLKEHEYYLSGQNIIDGELVEAYVSGTSVIAFTSSGTRAMAGLQLTPNALKYLPEGAYDLKDFKFYDTESTPLEMRTIVRRPNGEYFMINDRSDRYEDGGFNSYLGKKVTPL
jgi:hypothetical protein